MIERGALISVMEFTLGLTLLGCVFYFVRFRRIKRFLWDNGLKAAYRFMLNSRVIPYDCDSCLQRSGEGWECNCEPKEFEPEVRQVRSKEGSFEPDFTAVPRHRKIYCREFIPTRPYWRYLRFRRGRWVRPIGMPKSE